MDTNLKIIFYFCIIKRSKVLKKANVIVIMHGLWIMFRFFRKFNEIIYIKINICILNL